MATVNMERVRKRSASPQDLQHRKRQKTGISTSRPSAVNLALRHLMHDNDDSQLRKDDLNHVLDSICSPDTLSTLLRDPLAQLMGQVDTTEVSSSEKLAAVRNELLEAWTRRILQATGDSLNEVMNIAEARGPMTFELNGAKMELRFMPVVDIEDTEDAVTEAEEHAPASGVEQLSIQGRQDDSDESSETETDSTVSTETRRKQREENTGGSMGIFYSKPSRIQSRHIPLLERGYTMRELYGSPSITSSQERAREPPRRVEKPGQKDRMAVIAEHVSDDDEDADEEEEHAGSGPQGSESVRESTVGNEPMSPDASGVESDMEVDANYEAVLSRPRPQVNMLRFPVVGTPARRLVLRETKGLRKRNGGTLGQSEIIKAVSAANPDLPKCTVSIYDKTTRLIAFPTAQHASSALRRKIVMFGKRVELAPFQPKFPQAFVCKAVRPGMNISTIVADVLLAFPSKPFFAGWCPVTCLPDHLRHFLIVFDRPVDFGCFDLHAGKLQESIYRSQDHLDDCYACGKKHTLGECPELEVVNLPWNHERLLAAPPRLQSA
ncbi:hypothetical protein LTR17_000161 [Elasticomyces elasticus]|nr:hypothetical protein LTR17_000161 [Elasticomyces elasticus]